MTPALRAILMLIASNVFMTFAWYGHLRHMQDKKWYFAAIVSWSIALFEYLLQVPANRFGYQTMSVAQLKILQEVITLSVFIPFCLFFMKEKWNWNFLWAGFCMVAAVFFMFRK